MGPFSSFGYYIHRIFIQLFRIVSAILSLCVVFIKTHFAPTVNNGSFGNYVVTKVSAVAFSVKSWLYAMFARWRVDSYSVA